MATTPTTVHVDWLKERLGRAGLVILDVTWYSSKDAKEGYTKCHIPGAQHLNIMEGAEHTALFPRNIPSEEVFQKAVRAVGVSNDSHVILYDGTGQAGYFVGSRARWVFKVFGFDDVSILDGGLQKWQEKSYPTESAVTSAQEGDFTAKYSTSIRTTHDAMVSNLASRGAQVLDSRPTAKYAAGHYPGAINIPFAASLLDSQSGTLKSPEELKEVFKSAGVKLDQPVVTYCSSGMSSCSLLLAAQICGSKDASVYHGGFTEWSTSSPDQVEK